VTPFVSPFTVTPLLKVEAVIPPGDEVTVNVTEGCRAV
jgi:hypothetical protein